MTGKPEKKIKAALKKTAHVKAKDVKADKAKLAKILRRANASPN